MSPEIIYTATAVATAAGYSGGVIMERMAVNRAAGQRQQLAESWALSESPAATPDANPPAELSRAQRIARVAIAPVALGGALVLGLNTYAWLPASEAVEQKPATLEIVVDHSKATSRVIEGRPIANEINKVVGEFVEGPLATNVVIAKSGVLTPAKIGDVKNDVPFGGADMQKATTEAIGRANNVYPLKEADGSKRNAAVLVITNGNNIGKSAEVTELATTKYGYELATPVFVVNVEGAQAVPAVVNDMKAIAANTKAKYWSADTSNLNDVAKNVRETITGQERATKAKESPWMYRAFGGLAALTVLGFYLGRRKSPFQTGTKGQ